MKKTTILILTVAATLLAGCNTLGGLGRDMSSVGRTVEDAAK